MKEGQGAFREISRKITVLLKQEGGTRKGTTFFSSVKWAPSLSSGTELYLTEQQQEHRADSKIQQFYHSQYQQLKFLGI